MNCFLGADLGTTNVKILAMTPDGTVVAHDSESVDTLQPKPGCSEQSPVAVRAAFYQVLRSVCKQLAAKGLRPDVMTFSTAMHSLLAVDAAGKPLTNAILWSDNRAEKQVDRLKKDSPDFVSKLYRQTTIPLHPMTPFSKLLWFADNSRRIPARTVRWISLKEYIWHSLTGRYQIDFSMAGATGLFDTRRKRWYAPALDRAGIRPDQLSEPVPTTFTVEYDGRVGELPGFPAGVRLVAGASDGCLANLGAAAIEPGVTTLTIGTSGAIRRTVDKPMADPEQRLFCYILDDDADHPRYIVGGPTNNGGNVLQWLTENLTLQDTEETLKQAASVPAGSDGLLFLPYLQGERAPLWNAHARGAYLNVAWHHTQAHFIRAALEGVLFNLLTIENLLARRTGPTRIIHANGGFANSDLWVQMLADISGVPVRLNDSNESGSTGAILLGMKATGLVPTLQEASRLVGFGRTFEPDPACHAVYRQAFQRFAAHCNAEYHSA